MRDMGPHQPRWLHCGPTRDDGEERCRGALLDEQLQKGEGRWIDPVQVFYDKEHGMMSGQPKDKGKNHFKSLLTPILWCQG
jgi:hypothetical protein